MTTHDETTARPRRRDPLAPLDGRSARRKRVLIGGLIVLMVVLITGLFVTRTWPFDGRVREETAELVSSDGTRVTVRARVISGSLKVIAAPEVVSSSTWDVLTPPVRIEAQGLQGTFQLTFDPGPTWRDIPDEITDVICLSPTAGTTPVGSQRQPDGTITAETTCTGVTVGRPDRRDVEVEIKNPLGQPANANDPLAAALLLGRRDDTACRTDQVLVGVQGGTDTAPLCVEYLADQGVYRLAYGNWNGAPYVFTMRDGVTRTAAATTTATPTTTTTLATSATSTAPVASTTPKTGAAADAAKSPLLAYLSGDRGSKAALVPRAGALEASYPPEAATPGATIIGRPDVAGWVLYGLREHLVATAGVNKNAKRPEQAVALVDEAVAADPVTQCVTKAAKSLSVSSTIQDTVAAVKSAYTACLPTAVTSLAGTYAEFNGGNAARIGRRITSMMTPADQQTKRAESSFRTLLMEASEDTAATDPVTRTLPMPRFMTKDEVFALPVTPPRDVFAASRCPAPPAEGELRPAGVSPKAECLYILEADIDGNGKPDRAITWTAGRPDGVSSNKGTQGAAAHLDDGRVATLPQEEAAQPWLQDFEAVQGAFLANDNTEQVLVEYEDRGANTVWFAVVGLGSDGRLHIARDESGEVFPLAPGGGAQYSSGYGCYSRDGRGRVATWNWTASGSSPSGSSPGELKVTPVEITDLVAKRAGDDLNYVTPQQVSVTDQPVGSDCSQRDPGKRGAYEVNVPGVLTRAERDAQVQQIAQRAINAVLAGEESSIRNVFDPAAVEEAISMAAMFSQAGKPRPNLECTWEPTTNSLGLQEEGSCWASFESGAWLGVGVGRDTEGEMRAVGASMTAD